MNKNTYIKPEIVVEVLQSEVLMFSGSLSEGEVDTEAEGGQLSNSYRPRRGQWGDLWYVEEN